MSDRHPPIPVYEVGDIHARTVIVVQEWWGLNDHIRSVSDRVASEGFHVVAPDLYRGISTTDRIVAKRLMLDAGFPRPIQDMSDLVDHYTGPSEKCAVIGFCMGGALALGLAARRPDRVALCVPFYDVHPWPDRPEYTGIRAVVRGHYGSDDTTSPPDHAAKLERELASLGVDVVMEIYPDCDHAFCNDSRPEVYNASASEQAWELTFAALHMVLDDLGA